MSREYEQPRPRRNAALKLQPLQSSAPLSQDVPARKRVAFAHCCPADRPQKEQSAAPRRGLSQPAGHAQRVPLPISRNAPPSATSEASMQRGKGRGLGTAPLLRKRVRVTCDSPLNGDAAPEILTRPKSSGRSVEASNATSDGAVNVARPLRNRPPRRTEAPRVSRSSASRRSIRR